MAESEEAKQKSQHELRLSKAFDEAVKLSAPTAGESQRQHTPLSTRSLWSSISTGPVFGAPEPVGRPDVDHDFSSDDEGNVFPHISHPTSTTFSLAGLGPGQPEDELDGVPVFGADEEEEWDIALPKVALGDVESDRESGGRPAGLSDTRRAETQDDKNSTDRFLDAVSLSNVRTDGGRQNRSIAGGSSRQERSENVFQNPVVGDREEPPISPLMNIKDEPIDEGYDCALLPSTRSIKEELDNTAPEEELRISSVFSVGGGNAYGSPTAAPQTSTSIFGPGRSLVPQGPTMTLRSLAPVPQPPPPQPQPQPQAQAQAPSGSNPANAVRVSCSGCSKILLRGQTAFQRKGSTQLFCSTVCLTGFTLPPIKRRTCYQCLKEIEDPKDVISVITDNNLKDFCSQFCLSVFNRKRKPGTISMPSFQEPAAPTCSMCKKSDTIQHEVTHQGSLHKLCSDECFMHFRSSHNLVINVCESCGEYCASTDRNCRSLRVEGVTMKFCSRTCISTFKRTTTKVMPCGHCRDLRLMSDMVESTDTDGKVELFCNSICVNNSRPQNDLSGTAFPCTYCKVKAVSQYHLAMVDGSIRNFCSYTCVKTFREAEGSQPPPQQGQMNGSSSTAPPMVSPYLQTPPALPQGYSHPYPPSWVPTTGRPYAPTQISAPPLPYRAAPGLARAYGVGQHQPGPPMAPTSSFTSATSGPVKLSCHQCPQQFRWKPELYEYNGRTMQFCCKLCCVEFKKRSNIKVRCEYCKLEKVVKEVIRYDLIDRPFCSESCKLLFKHDMKGPWRTCAYCADISPKMIHNHFGGRMQEFCRDACMSNYTVLFYEMAKCECCRRQGKMREQLKCFGAIRHFCNLECVIQYCYQTFQLHPRTSNGTTTTQGPSQPLFSLSKPAPVIADVVSLATSPAGQPHATAATALTGALPTSNSHGKSLGDASTQTDAMRISARRRIMKNKAIICKPLMLDQETSCQIQTQAAEKPMAPMGFTETGFTYTENGEKVRVVVMPVPVPVFIPVPMNLYSQYTPVPMGIPVPVPVPMVIPPSLSRSELKDRKDGVASQTMAEQEKDKPVSHGDQGSAYSGDLESEAVSTPHSWGGEAVSTPHSWGGEDESTANPQRGTEGPGDPPSTTSSPNMLDLEADYPPESFDHAAVKGQRLTVQATRHKRSKDGLPPRKRSRKRSGTVNMVEQTVSLPPARSKLHHKYGVKAWKNWVLQRNKQFDCEFSKDPSKSMVLKEDVLQCNSSELSYGLCRFISEVRRPNGQAYPADSIFYLCLGIQQYLFANGRIENIFTDVLYHKFSMEITMMLHYWRPTLLPSGYLHSRVEEEYLWDCKQLGAYSPIVLLNTLLFFGTKLFQFKTQSQHRRLSFANFTHCTRVTKNGKSAFLRFRPCQDTAELLALPAKRKLDDEEGDMEMPENTENPLHCPVRLYEFYLSKCSESVKNRPGLFYLQPELSCHSSSSLWYSGQQLEGAALESMLTRILAVREVHLNEPPLHHHSTEASAASTDDNDDSS
ncbi:zinc finger MYM-type protein 4 isoform X2 [Coregonus clupeaformis]|uniref:zinc finger MYM-type protein 4 isoform X2 n=1 Tax=Coregonus clupeaformis TaxID=59861 RepID=UPI001E1C7DBC|nr:zinc finger MYM-type protein 4 isoform X2 [Coregonus clupeaformis]